MKVLGVTFQSSLKWDVHVSNIAKAAAKRVYVLRYLKRIPVVTKKDLLALYKNYILSVLEFNSPLFTGLHMKNSEKLERMQKRCHGILCGCGCKCNAFVSLDTRRRIQAANTFFKIMDPTAFLIASYPTTCLAVVDISKS